VRAAHRQIEISLAQELLDRIQAAPPDFFERLIVALLLGMGYGGSVVAAGRALGRSGDDGVDGVIDQDALGLDRDCALRSIPKNLQLTITSYIDSAVRDCRYNIAVAEPLTPRSSEGGGTSERSPLAHWPADQSDPCAVGRRAAPC
jgi:hypothetical protein